MTVSVNYKPTLKWHGVRILAKIHNKADEAVMKAAEHLKEKIQAKLRRHVGSIYVGSRLVKAVEFSPPGDPPYEQTGNLANSVKASVEKQKTQVKGSVGTRVNYAKTLEEGGFTRWTGQQHLRFTHVKLVNPIKKSGLPVAPRPVWRPTFEEENRRMLEIVKEELKKVF